VILDIGARDCRESVAFAQEYPTAQVYAFECNPATIPDCHAAIAASGCTNLHLVEAAVASHTGPVTFYSVDKVQRRGYSVNTGASSLFPASGHMQTEPIYQQAIVTMALRLDDWAKRRKIDKFDVVWLDLQGAEQLALDGMGGLLGTVQVIHTEVTYKELYAGQVMYPDLAAFLKDNGFVEVYHEKAVTVPEWFGEAVYVQKELALR
jgi:FkbM family methyltransferase